jgi:hypothetical protein
MSRQIKDTTLNVAGTLPNAANTTYSNVIDLGATTPFPITEQITVRVSIGVATGANNKNINIRIQDSATNNTSNFTNVALIAIPILRSVDANAAGHSASNVNIALPPSIKRYVRAAATGEANGGDSSDGAYYVEILT